MLAGFVITFREAVEVGLILAIILSYLRKLGRNELVKHAYWGTLIGAVASGLLAVSLPTIYGPETAEAIGGPISSLAFFGALLILAYMMRRYMDLGLAPLLMIVVALTLIFAGLYGYSVTKALGALEAGALFSAALILTYVMYWMAKVAYKLKERIVSKIDLSITTGKTIGVLTLTAAAVLREGAEVSLLVYAAMLLEPLGTAIGALLGVLAATMLSYVYIKRSVRLNWRRFFVYTSVLLMAFCSGILKVGVEDLVQLGLAPSLLDRVYDASAILPEQGIVGGLLYVFVGYTDSPPLTPLLVQLIYLVFALRMLAPVYHLQIPWLAEAGSKFG